jgi:hypothetical protein
MNQFFNPIYWRNIATGEILAHIPKDLDIYKQAACFERVNEKGEILEDICIST